MPFETRKMPSQSKNSRTLIVVKGGRAIALTYYRRIKVEDDFDPASVDPELISKYKTKVARKAWEKYTAIVYD
jgi:hypothetical protein